MGSSYKLERVGQGQTALRVHISTQDPSQTLAVHAHMLQVLTGCVWFFYETRFNAKAVNKL